MHQELDISLKVSRNNNVFVFQNQQINIHVNVREEAIDAGPHLSPQTSL